MKNVRNWTCTKWHRFGHPKGIAVLDSSKNYSSIYYYFLRISYSRNLSGNWFKNDFFFFFCINNDTYAQIFSRNLRCYGLIQGIILVSRFINYFWHFNLKEWEKNWASHLHSFTVTHGKTNSLTCTNHIMTHGLLYDVEHIVYVFLEQQKYRRKS